MIKAWSYSALEAYETCPKRFWHLNVAKDIKEEKSEAQMEGIQVHKAIEDFIMRGKPLPVGLVHMEKVYAPYRAACLALPGSVYGEQKLAITAEYVPTGWFADDVWFRTILDLMVVGDKHAVVVDHKTGKTKNDMTQLELMAAVGFLIRPQLEVIDAAYVWTKSGKVTGKRIHAEDCIDIWSNILPRVERLQEAHRKTEFPPTHSGLCKRYCPVTSCPYHGS